MKLTSRKKVCQKDCCSKKNVCEGRIVSSALTVLHAIQRPLNGKPFCARLQQALRSHMERKIGLRVAPRLLMGSNSVHIPYVSLPFAQTPVTILRPHSRIEDTLDVVDKFRKERKS